MHVKMDLEEIIKNALSDTKMCGSLLAFGGATVMDR